MHGCMDG